MSGGLWSPASLPRLRKLSGAGAELCLGLRGAHKRKVSVLGECEWRWGWLEGYTDHSHGVQVIPKGRRVFTSTVEGGNRSASSQSCDLCRNKAWNKSSPSPTVFLFSAAGRGRKLGRKEVAEEKVTSFCCFSSKRERPRDGGEQPLSIPWPSLHVYVGRGNILSPMAPSARWAEIASFTTEEDAAHELKKNLSSQKLKSYLHQRMFDAQLGTQLQLLQTHLLWDNKVTETEFTCYRWTGKYNFFFNYTEQCKMPVPLDVAINCGLLVTLLTVGCL